MTEQHKPLAKLMLLLAPTAANFAAIGASDKQTFAYV
jgi:hypothetical protein